MQFRFCGLETRLVRSLTSEACQEGNKALLSLFVAVQRGRRALGWVAAQTAQLMESSQKSKPLSPAQECEQVGMQSVEIDLLSFLGFDTELAADKKEMDLDMNRDTRD